jgi:hypothetical protein
MKKKPTIFDPTVGDDRTVLVRPITGKERYQYCGGGFDQQFYTLTDIDGNLVAIVRGKPELAFRMAEEIQSKPHWVH